MVLSSNQTSLGIKCDKNESRFLRRSESLFGETEKVVVFFRHNVKRREPICEWAGFIYDYLSFFIDKTSSAFNFSRSNFATLMQK